MYVEKILLYKEIGILTNIKYYLIYSILADFIQNIDSMEVVCNCINLENDNCVFVI